MIRDWSRWAIVPRGVHVILAANQAAEYGDIYLCKMFDPDGGAPSEYQILVDSTNIYESREAAERRIFHDKLKGEPTPKKPRPPRNRGIKWA